MTTPNRSDFVISTSQMAAVLYVSSHRHIKDSLILNIENNAGTGFNSGNKITSSSQFQESQQNLLVQVRSLGGNEIGTKLKSVESRMPFDKGNALLKVKFLIALMGNSIKQIIKLNPLEFARSCSKGFFLNSFQIFIPPHNEKNSTSADLFNCVFNFMFPTAGICAGYCY